MVHGTTDQIGPPFLGNCDGGDTASFGEPGRIRVDVVDGIDAAIEHRFHADAGDPQERCGDAGASAVIENPEEVLSRHGDVAVGRRGDG